MADDQQAAQKPQHPEPQHPEPQHPEPQHPVPQHPVPKDPVQQNPVQNQQNLFKINMWLVFFITVLLILLAATALAPYVHFGTASDTKKIITELEELKKAFKSNHSSGLTAQHFDKEVKSLKCEVQKLTRAAPSSKNDDTKKIVNEIDELMSEIQSLSHDQKKKKQFDEKLHQMESKWGDLKKNWCSSRRMRNSTQR